jgi:hypothetical protein
MQSYALDMLDFIEKIKNRDFEYFCLRQISFFRMFYSVAIIFFIFHGFYQLFAERGWDFLVIDRAGLFQALEKTADYSALGSVFLSVLPAAGVLALLFAVLFLLKKQHKAQIVKAYVITLFFSLIMFSSVLAAGVPGGQQGIPWYGMLFMMTVYAVPVTISTLMVDDTLNDFIKSMAGFSIFVLAAALIRFLLTGSFSPASVFTFFLESGSLFLLCLLINMLVVIEHWDHENLETKGLFGGLLNMALIPLLLLMALFAAALLLTAAGNGLIHAIAGGETEEAVIWVKDLLAPFYYIYFSLLQSTEFANPLELAGAFYYVLAISAVSYRIYAKIDERLGLEEFEPFAFFRSLAGTAAFSYFLSPVLPLASWLATLIIFALIAGGFTVLALSSKS